MANHQFSPLVDSIIEGMDDRKAEKITVLDLSDIENSVCDYFVICEGNSNTQVDAIASSVEEKVRQKTGEKPWHVEGQDLAEWVLVDYVDTVAHVFQRSTREFYDLEGLWGDAKITEIAAG
jgi:ribosome-associated protein